MALALLGCKSRDNSRSPGLTGSDQVALNKGEKLAATVDHQQRVVRPMDDPANPFRGQYNDWDRWLFDNLVATTDGFPPPPGSTFEETKQYLDAQLLKRAQGQLHTAADASLRTQVTVDGYLVPVLHGIADWEIAVAAGRSKAYYDALPWVEGTGHMEPALKQAYDLAVDAIRSQNYPAVPDWLVAAPPLGAMLLPNSEILTQGPLGSWHPSDGDPHSASHAEDLHQSHDWYRYSADGTLLSQAHGFWWFTYHDPEALGYPEGDPDTSLHGYVTFRAKDSREPLSYWTYDGRRLEQAPSTPMDIHNFHLIPGGMLLKLHAGKASNLGGSHDHVTE
jgi:hypothetical protein